jgi:hypothetical protein
MRNKLMFVSSLFSWLLVDLGRPNDLVEFFSSLNSLGLLI